LFTSLQEQAYQKVDWNYPPLFPPETRSPAPFSLPRSSGGKINTSFFEPIHSLRVKIFEGRANRYYLMHLHLCQFVTEAEAMGQSACLHRMCCHVSLKGFHVSFSKNPVEFPMKSGITLFQLKLVHVSFLTLFFQRVRAIRDRISVRRFLLSLSAQ